MCKNLQKDLVIVPDMQQFHQLGYNWTANGWMLLHQGTNILLISIDIVTNVTHLKTISNTDSHSCYCNYTS